MTDAQASRLAKERFGFEAYIISKTDKPKACDPPDYPWWKKRCHVGTWQPAKDGKEYYGMGPTWEHAFIDAGVTP